MGRPAQGEVAQRGHAEVERPQVATVRKHRRGAGGREGLESGGDGRQQEHGLVGQTDSAKERSSVGAGQAAFHFLSAYLFAFAFIRGRKGGKTIIMWERGPNPSNSRGGGRNQLSATQRSSGEIRWGLSHSQYPCTSSVSYQMPQQCIVSPEDQHNRESPPRSSPGASGLFSASQQRQLDRHRGGCTDIKSA